MLRGGATLRIDRLVNHDIHDVLVLGSSRAHHHYDTPYLSDSLGIDVYNAGYDGFGVIMADGLLELVLERYQPKLVIFDITYAFDLYKYPQDNQDRRYVSLLKPYYRHKPINRLIYDISKEEWYKVHSGLIRYNSDLVVLLLDYLNNRGNQNLGFAPKSGVLSDYSEQEDDEILVIDPLKIKYMENLIWLAQSNNVPIVFIKSPRYGVTDSEIIKPARDICQRFNIPYFDYRTDPEFQRSDYFYDPHHLNSIGARAFTKRVAKDVLLECL